MGVVGFIGAFALESAHVSLGVVSDDGEGFSHGYPSHEDVSGAVDVGGVAGTVCKVDAASKEAIVGALGFGSSKRGFAKVDKA